LRELLACEPDAHGGGVPILSQGSDTPAYVPAGLGVVAGGDGVVGGGVGNDRKYVTADPESTSVPASGFVAATLFPCGQFRLGWLAVPPFWGTKPLASIAARASLTVKHTTFGTGTCCGPV